MFYLWRYTKDPKYRDIAWDIFLVFTAAPKPSLLAQAIEKHCKTESAYSDLMYVDGATPIKTNVMSRSETASNLTSSLNPSYFFAETLKYLYLIFSPDEIIDLHQYVFTTEAHPLKIRLTS